MRIHALLLLIFFISINSIAQWKNSYVFSRISKGTGLASDVVSGAAQDSDGYLWFATGNGVQRYDGSRFITIKHIPGDSTSVPEAMPSGILFDSKQRLWLSFSGNRIGILDIHKFTFKPVKIILPADVRNNDFYRFREERDGNLTILVGNYGIITYDEKANAFSAAFNAVQFEEGKVASDLCYAGQPGNYWVSSDKGFDLYDNIAKKSVQGEFTPFLQQLNKFLKDEKVMGPSGSHYDSLGNFWTILWSGTRGIPEILRYNTRSKVWDTYSSSLLTSTGGYFDIANIIIQRDGTVWAYGGNIFARLNSQTNKFEDVRNESLLNHGTMIEIINRLFEDKDGNIWICTTSGLYYFNPGKQFFVNLSNQRNDNRKYTNASDAVIQLKNGNILTTAWGAGIFTYDSNFNVTPNTIIPKPDSNMGMSVWDMLERKNGDIWMAIQGGEIRIYNQQTRKMVNEHLSVFEDHTVRQLAEDSIGNMWMGTQSGLIIKCANANWHDTIHAFSIVQRLKGHVVKLAVDSYGYVWACTDRFGVFKLDPHDGKIVDHYSDHSPEDRRLNVAGASDIMQYNDSIMLLASGTVNKINLKTGKINYGDFKIADVIGHAVSFIKDKTGAVWVGTFDGLYRYVPGKKYMTYYDGEDGITDTRFQPNATEILRDGKLIFGTTTGLLMVDPNKLKLPTSAPMATISEFKVFDKELNVDSLLKLTKVSLPYTYNSLSFYFTSFNYNHEFAVKYQLEGLDKNWKIASENAAQYSYLAPGLYTLKIIALSAGGIESAERNIIIEIKPPFWNSWGFYGLLILVIIGILYLIDRERMKRIRSTQQIRSEIGFNLATDVTTTLSNINLMSEMAKRKADSDIERSKELIGQISEKSNNMITALDDMLWSIDPANDKMDKMLQRMSEYTDAMKKNFDTEITLKAEERLTRVDLNMKLRYGLFTIFKEGLKSIIQYSNGKQTLINIDLYKNKVLLKIQDNTAQFVADINSHRASEEMKKHAEAMNAELDLQQDKNGIYIFLMFPIK